ncbi:MAG TPA: hypothetical protein VEH06_04735 [Candidatus Bathyarchaeia archaeon]|nr:hypothetical protein [Candidatus Bathyarchaeia archaeon]
MTTELYASLLVVCGLLVAVSAIQRYASNFIIPGVTIMMFIGAISVIVPLYNSDIKTVYNSIVNKAPDLILLVLIPPCRVALQAGTMLEFIHTGMVGLATE